MKQVKPAFLKQYFWDVKWSEFTPDDYPFFCVERILECGDEKSYAWLKKNFPAVTIKEVIKKSKRLSKKSANYWSVIYNINKQQIPCLKRQSQKTPKTLWRY